MVEKHQGTVEHSYRLERPPTSINMLEDEVKTEQEIFATGL